MADKELVIGYKLSPYPDLIEKKRTYTIEVGIYPIAAMGVLTDAMLKEKLIVECKTREDVWKKATAKGDELYNKAQSM